MSTSCLVIDPADSLTPPCVPALRRELASSPYWSLRQIDCYWHEGRVIVRGTVTSFYLKQLAQSAASRIAGVGRVQIEIDVTPE